MNSMRLLLLLAFIATDQSCTEADQSILEGEIHPVQKFDTVNGSSKVEWNDQLYLENKNLDGATIDKQPVVVDIQNAITSILDEICYKINMVKSIITTIDQQIKPLMELHAQDWSIYFKEHKYTITSSIFKPFTTIQPVFTVKPITTDEPITTIKPTTTVEPVVSLDPVTTVNPDISSAKQVTTEEPHSTSINSNTALPEDSVSYIQGNVNNEFPKSGSVIQPSYQMPLPHQNIYQLPPYQFWPHNYFPQPNPQIDYQPNIQYVPYPTFFNPDSYSSGNLNSSGINYQNSGINYNQPASPNSANIRPQQFSYAYNKPEPVYPLNPIWLYDSQMTRPEASSILMFPNSGLTYSTPTIQPISAVDSSLLQHEHKTLSDDSRNEFNLNQFEKSTSALNNDEAIMWSNRKLGERAQAQRLTENMAIDHNYGRTFVFPFKIPSVFKSNNGSRNNVKI